MPLIPIDNQPLKYVNDLQVSIASNTTLSIAAGAARDSTNIADIVLTEAATLNTANIGKNGLDTGTLANSTWYAVFVIGSTQNTAEPATLLSTSQSSPYIPDGYDVFKRIGWVKTDGSAHFLACDIIGNGNKREYFWDAPITELNAQGSATYAAVDMASAMPPTAQIANLQCFLVPNTVTNVALLRKTGSTSTTNQAVNCPVVSPRFSYQPIRIVTNASQSIDYKTTEATDDLTINVVGFEDFI